MNEPTFSLAYTSARAAFITSVVQKWRQTATGKYKIEVVIAVDANRPDTIDAANSVPDAKVVIQPDPPFTCVAGWNLAAANTTGKVIINVADDFNPCDGWDEKLANLRPNWMEEDWVAHTEDAYVHDIIVLPIVTRVRYERFGYILYPKYLSLFSDTELTEVAYREGRVINAKHILMEHMHPDCQKRDRDEIDLTHASDERWKLGEMLFNYRKHRNFPVDVGPKAVSQTASLTEKAEESPSVQDEFCAYIQANRNDLCLGEVCQRMFEEGIRYFFFCVPDEYWSGKPTLPEEIAEVYSEAGKLKKLGAKVWTRTFTISDFRFPGENRITIETRVRNESLSWVRQNGFSHICVLDSDELWPKGSLKIIKDVVSAGSPLAISLPMTPVVGFPGYPINAARDRVISYVGHACVFRDCRTPVGSVYYENGIRVYHFTGTRRTMEETIEKHRQSGHFDDPEYDFKEFIDKVLPNIKPGFRHKYPNGPEGVHFYKRYQIWDSVRDWLPEEVQDIPASLWPFLGKS